MNGLYIHIPFCQQKCSYCDFCSVVAGVELKRRYIDKLIEESIKYMGMAFDTVFIGGGTPTCLPDGEMTRLFDGISKNLDIMPKEFTIEGNPNSYTRSKVAEYKALGMTRASVGAQSFDDNLLKKLGRIHNACQAKDSIKYLVDSCFDVSCDIMIGLQGQDKASVANDINTALSLGVGHVSCYGLIVEKGTQLHFDVESGRLRLPDEDSVADMYDLATDILNKNGLKRYEISNFGKPCLHNLGYWQLKPYVGLGASAHSLIDNIRYYNTSDIDDYINNQTRHVEEVLTQQELVREKIILGLRTIYGVNLSEIASQYGDNQYKRVMDIVSQDANCYEIINGALTIKQNFWYCQNLLLAKF